MEKYFTRIFIAINVIVIVAIYYLSEIVPFEYEGYENDVNRLQKYDAELDSAIVNTRFGLIRNYQPIVKALDGSYSVLEVLKQELKENPNEDIAEKLKNLEDVFYRKVNLTEKYKQMNPVLRNAIASFSSTMYSYFDQASNVEFIESCLEGIEQTQLVDNVGVLFRDILIYTNAQNENRRSAIIKMIEKIENSPDKVPEIDLGIVYARKILELQPQLTQVAQDLFEMSILQSINELNTAYRSAFDNYQENSVKYRVVLYVLVFLLLVILTWSFRRLQSTVNILHIEVKRKVKAEKELEEINRQLEQRVADRTKELTIKNNDLNKALGDLEDAQEQLIMQEKMASVGMLSTGIAHEIKNPLNFVNNFSDISVELVKELDEELETVKDKVAEDNLSMIQEILEDLKTNCQKVKEHGVRADNIVKNMLLHSQEAGVEKEMVDIKNLMEDNIRIALDKYLTEDKKFEVNFVKNYDPDLQKILCAPQTLARVFVYMLDNALYSVQDKRKLGTQPDYKPEISVSLQQKDNKIVIKIRDNGIGIPKHQLDKVFEPFFTTKPTGRGNTGLGLSICYDTVVKQHKGELRAASEEGTYTEFTIELPVNSQTKN